MATRSLNKVILIGNLTRDPELRYTPSGTPVCSFGLATNRSWTTSGSSEKQEETEFHSVVAWSKLAELCAQLLAKGRKVYIEGRLQTRSWESANGEKRTKTEIVAEDMIILDSKFKNAESDTVKTVEKAETHETAVAPVNEDSVTAPVAESTPAPQDADVTPATETKEDLDLDKIPF